MENILEFIKEQKITYLGTIENGDQARVRPMSALTEINGKLTWCTSNQKALFNEVVASPKVEICMFNSKKIVRLSGRCVPTKDATVKEKYLELQPAIAKTYGGQADTFEVFVFETAQAIVTEGKNQSIIDIY